MTNTHNRRTSGYSARILFRLSLIVMSHSAERKEVLHLIGVYELSTSEQ